MFTLLAVVDNPWMASLPARHSGVFGDHSNVSPGAKLMLRNLYAAVDPLSNSWTVSTEVLVLCRIIVPTWDFLPAGEVNTAAAAFPNWAPAAVSLARSLNVAILFAG